jgi:hypothetical protein
VTWRHGETTGVRGKKKGNESGVPDLWTFRIINRGLRIWKDYTSERQQFGRILCAVNSARPCAINFHAALGIVSAMIEDLSLVEQGHSV